MWPAKLGINCVRFHVLTTASMMFRVVFWVILPCKMIVDRRFRGAYCLHHQGWWNYCFEYFRAMTGSAVRTIVTFFSRDTVFSLHIECSKRIFGITNYGFRALFYWTAFPQLCGLYSVEREIDCEWHRHICKDGQDLFQRYHFKVYL
jgi:hypothetical protein